MSIAKHQLAALVSGAYRVPERERVAAFLRDPATKLTSNPFAATQAATARHVWNGRAYDWRVMGVETAGHPARRAPGGRTAHRGNRPVRLLRRNRGRVIGVAALRQGRHATPELRSAPPAPPHGGCGAARPVRRSPLKAPRRVALPWYQPAHYTDLRASLADGAKLPERYEAWLLSAEQIEGVVQRSGVEVVRVVIEPDAFLAWCDREGISSDGSARSRYAAEFITG